MRSIEAERNIDFSEISEIRPDQIKDIHAAAVVEIVSSMNVLIESEFPETLSLDFEKVFQLRKLFHFFVVAASMLGTVKDAIFKAKNPDDLRVCRLL